MEIENVEAAIEQIAQTTVHNIATVAARAALIGILLGGIVLTSCGREGSSTPAASSSSSMTARVATAELDRYQPLFPFATASAVDEWRGSYAAGGHDPWHLDPAETALAFARWLGYGDIDRTTSQVTDGTGAHVGVGYRIGDADRASTAAVVHLVRWGAGPDAPWEVVGTDDTYLTVTAPAYGATVASPVRVGGRITGVDESITVEVRTVTSPAPVGTKCCLPAGGESTPWSAMVAFTAPAGSRLVVSARTGGHVVEVERFAVTAARVAG